MHKKIKILHVEDVPTDAELIARELKTKLPKFEHYIVDNKVDYINALENFSPDIILCDHSLPSFNSIEALSLLKNSGLKIPFILVTAAMTEEVAEELVNQGVDDYIIKDRLKRVSSAVINAIEKYEFERERTETLHRAIEKEKQAKKKLRDVSNKLLLATKASQIGVWHYNLTDESLVVNDIFLSIYGISQGFKQYKDWLKFVHHEDTLRVEAELAEAIHGNKKFDTEFRIIKHDNSLSYIKATALVERDEEGRPVQMVGTNLDITQQKVSQQLVESSEAKYRSFFENSMDAILLTSPDGAILSANAAACSIFYMTEQEICERGRAALLDTTDARLAPLLEQRRKSGRAFGELTFIRKNGIKFPGELSSAIFTDSNGQTRTSMIIRDISERKNMEEALVEEKEKYTDLFLHAPSLVGMFTGPQHVFEKANPKYLELTGKNNIIGKTFKEVFPEMEGQEFSALLDLVFSSGKPFIGKEMLLKINKEDNRQLSDIYLDFICQPHRNSNGNVQGLLFFANDVTEQVEARKKIEDSETRYKQLFNYAPLPQFIIDSDTLEFVKVNDAAVEHYGYSMNEFMCMTLLDFYKVNEKEVSITSIKKLAEGKTPSKAVTNHIKKDGETIVVELSVAHIVYHGKACMLSSVNDITERVHLQQRITSLEISAQKKIAKAQIKAQENERRYIGEELHDNINQQLATIRLYLDMAFANEQMRLDLIQKGEKLLIKSINEIRSLCRRLVPPILKDLGLGEALTELVESYRVVQKFDIYFEIHPCLQEIEEDLKITFFRIIQEQLNNILKHGEAKTIWIKFTYSDSNINLVIKDDGKGFNLKIKRMGTGLVNIKNRIGLYNGLINIISSPGNGCELRISVPYNYMSATTATTYIDILIAEDDPEDRELISEVFQSYNLGLNLCFTSNGKELIQTLKQLSQDKLPSLVILDYYMPEMNGVETLKELEANTIFKKLPKVIYSAGWLRTGNKKALGSDSVLYIEKGATYDKISENVREMLNHRKNAG